MSIIAQDQALDPVSLLAGFFIGLNFAAFMWAVLTLTMAGEKTNAPATDKGDQT